MVAFLGFGFLLLLVYQANSADHTIVIPKAFRIDTSENIVLNLHGYNKATVSAYLQDALNPSSKFSRTDSIMLNENSAAEPVIMKMKVSSDDIDVTQPNLRVILVVQVTDSNENFVKTQGVLVTKQSGYIFVTTDKPVYRPGESVSVLVSTLDQSMRQYGNSFVTITIKNSPGHGVERAERLQTTTTGFFGLMYEVDRAAELGLYEAEAKYSNASYETSSMTNFAVLNYDLPLFQVSIDIANPFVFSRDEAIIVNVKASYSSSSQSVDGTSSATVTLKKTPLSQPIEIFKIPRNGLFSGPSFKGSHLFRISSAEIDTGLDQDESFSSLAAMRATLRIATTVVDSHTGIMESAEAEIPFVSSPYRIVTERTLKYFIPRAQYRLQADIMDAVGKKPRPDVSIQILVVQSDQERSFFTQSDDNGQINFLIDMPDSYIQPLRITTVEPNLDSAYQASVSLELLPYQSASNSYLQIHQETRLQRVGTNSFLTFRYNQEVREIRFFVLARGSIVVAGTNNPIPSNRESTDFIHITQKMVPSARAVAYYFNDKELVSDSIWFDVEDQCKTELSSNAPTILQPSIRVGIDISGSRNAIVGYQASDKAFSVFHQGSRLSRKDMFDKMESHDQGCGKGGGNDGSEVFWNAGLTISSERTRQLLVNSLQCNDDAGQRRRKKRQVIADESDEINDDGYGDCLEYSAFMSVLQNKSCEQWVYHVENKKDDFRLACKEQFFHACKKARSELRVNTFPSTAIRKQEKKSETQRLKRSPGSVANPLSGRVRSNFDEQVFGNLLDLNTEGRIVYYVRSPDTIATFQIESLSSQYEEDGFCIANSLEVRVHKDVFIKILPPYTLERLKQTTIKITVFNDCAPETLKVDLQVRLERDIMCSRYSSGQWETLAALSIRQMSSLATALTVLPLRVPRDGTTSIKVRVVTNERLILDQVDRSFAIKVSGQTKYTTDSFPLIVDEGGESTFPISLQFPEGVLPDTRKCYMIVEGVMAGQSSLVKPLSAQLNNLESFFKQPTGSGYASAQISGVNIFVHDYLVSRGILLPNTPSYVASVRRITDGYSRLLQERRRQFVENGSPSIWLNAFVVKVFSKAKAFIPDIDTSALCQAVAWLSTQQVNNKYFQELNPVFHQQFKIPGSDSQNLIFTTHILIFLMEAQRHSICSSPLNQRVQVIVRNGIEHLVSNKLFTENSHALALLSYALSLHEPTTPRAREIFNRLLRAGMGQNKVYWQVRSLSYVSGRSYHNYWYNVQKNIANVETRAYALLAGTEMFRRQSVSDVPQDFLDLAGSVASWLIHHHNQGGTNAAPEETVVTLQALTAYGHATNTLTSPMNLTVSVTTGLGGQGPTFQINESNTGSQIRTELPTDIINAGRLTAVATGRGSGILTSTCSYQIVETCHFNIEHHISVLNQVEVEEENAMLELRITVIVSLPPGSSPTDLTVVEIDFLPGFLSVQRRSLVFLDAPVDRYEITDVRLILYLRQVTSTPLVLPFDTVQTVRPAQSSPSRILVYDYYEPRISCDVFYSLPSQTSMLRTSNCEVSRRENFLCKCAEGDCATCRTRDDQISATVCLRRGSSCDTCDENRNCENMFARACRSNFVYVVNVTSVPDFVPRDVFVGFEGEIMEILKLGDHFDAERDLRLKFLMRRDCFLGCTDDALVQSGRTGSNYIVPGRFLLIMGSAPESFVNRIGTTEYSYQLDGDATLERVTPQTSCERYRQSNERYNGNCNNARPGRRRERCERTKKLIAACNNLNNLQEALHTGCEK